MWEPRPRIASVRAIDLAETMDLRDVPATLATKQGVAIGGRMLAAAGSPWRRDATVARYRAAVAAVDSRNLAPPAGCTAGKGWRVAAGEPSTTRRNSP